MRICLVCEGISDTEQDCCASCGLRLLETTEVHFPRRRGEADAGNPLLGTLIDGKYRITNVLGKGGMGTVFRAVHEVSLVPVALKILHSRYARRAEHRAHFLAEARKAGSVVHEHSARILDVGEDADGTVYIAMEMVEGETLAEWIHVRRCLGPADVVDILYQICQALAIAHDVGLVHRDLSPRNVMGLLREGRPFVKILDFGIAKGAAVQRSGRTAEGDAGGAPVGFANPPYSAPEHLEGLEVDARADLYSLGVIAFEALTRRLPVEGKSSRELAAATLEGRLQPLRPPSGTPSRLVRLVMELLSRNPQQRPTSARDVMRELNRIRNPRSQALRTVAALSLLVTLPAFLVTHAEPREVYLELQPGSKLVLGTERSKPEDVVVQALRSSDLDDLHFQYGGFDPAELELQAGYLGGVLPAEGVVPTADRARKRLTFSRSASPEYAAFLAELSRNEQPVELVFRTRDRPGMAYAMVLVDDDPPEVQLGSVPAGVEVLTGTSAISVSARDKSGLEALSLIVTWAEGGGRERAEIPLGRRSQLTGQADALLGDRVQGVAARSAVEIRTTAVDRAGNVTVANPVLRFAVMDLRAPGVVEVRGRADGEVTYRADGARMHVRLDDAEPDLSLVVRAPGGEVQRLALRSPRAEHDVVLQPVLDDPETPFPSGEYVFAVADAAGNVGTAHRAVCRFRSEDPGASLRVEPAAGDVGGRAVVVGDEPRNRILTDGGAVRFSFRCNPLYVPQHLTLRSVTRAGAGTEVIEPVELEPGLAVFELDGLADGEYQLVCEMTDRAGVGRPSKSYELHVLRQGVELRLPDTTGRRYLRQLVDIDLLTQESHRVGPGRAWRLVPADVRLLQGRVWLGSPDSLVPQPLPTRQLRDDPLFSGRELLNGENVLAVELSDLLGRPVDVWIGASRARATAVPAGPEVREVARFWYHSEPVKPVRPVVEVEAGQATKIELRSPLPFRPREDSVQLQVGPALLTPAAIEPRGSGATLTFSVPFKAIEQAAQAGGLQVGELTAGRVLPLTARLDTVARGYDLEFEIRILRSTLQPVVLESLASRPLAAELARVEMVPLLAPDREVYDDPVPDDTPMRWSFRPFPPFRVRNVEDLFLQHGEVTRGQYDALIEVAGQRVGAQDAASLVHAWDPLGPARLSAMLPSGFGGDGGAWARAVAAGPDRPVTGVDFFQAYTAARVAGYAVAGDPELFRLPMGLELELAALGWGDDRRPNALHGCGGGEGHLSVERFLAMGAGRGDPGRWPPTARESVAAGDVTMTRQRYQLAALDFGVREWVLDLPYLHESPGRDLLAAWVSDHREHVGHAMAFARGLSQPRDSAASTAMSTIRGLEPDLARNGVVRGVPAGDARALVDVMAGGAAVGADAGALPEGVPGVVRVLVLRRDGREGLLDEIDPRLHEVGFRLAGGRAFVREARR